jgi:hypothetical protein
MRSSSSIPPAGVAGVAEEETRVHRVNPVDVLPDRDRERDALDVHVLRQRRLDQHAMDRLVQPELLEQRDEVPLGGCLRERELPDREPVPLEIAPNLPCVALRGRIRPGPDDRQCRRGAVVRCEVGRVRLDFGA